MPEPEPEAAPAPRLSLRSVLVVLSPVQGKLAELDRHYPARPLAWVTPFPSIQVRAVKALRLEPMAWRDLSGLRAADLTQLDHLRIP